YMPSWKKTRRMEKETPPTETAARTLWWTRLCQAKASCTTTPPGRDSPSMRPGGRRYKGTPRRSPPLAPEGRWGFLQLPQPLRSPARRGFRATGRNLFSGTSFSIKYNRGGQRKEAPYERTAIDLSDVLPGCLRRVGGLPSLRERVVLPARPGHP